MSQVIDPPAATEVTRALFTAEEVAEALALSMRLVRQLTAHGDISCRRIGRLVRYAQSDIDAFVSAREAHRYS